MASKLLFKSFGVTSGKMLQDTDPPKLHMVRTTVATSTRMNRIRHQNNVKRWPYWLAVTVDDRRSHQDEYEVGEMFCSACLRCFDPFYGALVAIDLGQSIASVSIDGILSPPARIDTEIWVRAQDHNTFDIEEVHARDRQHNSASTSASLFQARFCNAEARHNLAQGIDESMVSQTLLELGAAKKACNQSGKPKGAKKEKEQGYYKNVKWAWHNHISQAEGTSSGHVPGTDEFHKYVEEKWDKLAPEEQQSFSDRVEVDRESVLANRRLQKAIVQSEE